MRSFSARVGISALLLAAISSPLVAQDAKLSSSNAAPWVRVSEGNLAVYTQGDPAQSSLLLHSFAQLRNALAQASPFRVDQSANLKIIAFHSEREFNRYRLSAGSCAYYQQTHRSEYIVLQDLNPAHHELFSHEFTHFVLAHSGVSLPLWLNEGLADFYSTFHIDGNRVIFGRSVPGRLHVLHSSEWLPLDKLFEVSPSSPYYSELGRMTLFYSESWALAHMLVVSPSYAAGFPKFLQALSEGHTAAEGFQLVYHKTPAQLETDLRDYVDQQHLPVIEAQLTSVSDAPAAASMASVSNADMDFMLADLAVANPNARVGLEAQLASAASQVPGSPDAEENLGYLALRQGKSAAARAHFQLAVDRHSSDPGVLFYLAHLNHEAGAPSDQVIPLLQRALSLKPGLSEARLELALVQTSDGNFPKALEALQNLTGLHPENVYAAAYTEAYCYAHTDKLPEARIAAQRAQTLAGNDHDRAETSELLDYIKQQAQ
jgi:tetratricopeptide (TPR) repeat protein